MLLRCLTTDRQPDSNPQHYRKSQTWLGMLWLQHYVTETDTESKQLRSLKKSLKFTRYTRLLPPQVYKSSKDWGSDSEQCPTSLSISKRLASGISRKKYSITCQAACKSWRELQGCSFPESLTMLGWVGFWWCSCLWVIPALVTDPNKLSGSPSWTLVILYLVLSSAPDLGWTDICDLYCNFPGKVTCNTWAHVFTYMHHTH